MVVGVRSVGIDSRCGGRGVGGGVGADVNIAKRYSVIQIKRDGTTMEWGTSVRADGGRLAAACACHPDTKIVQVEDSMDGGLSYQITKNVNGNSEPDPRGGSNVRSPEDQRAFDIMFEKLDQRDATIARLTTGFKELIDAVKVNGKLVSYHSSIIDRAEAALDPTQGRPCPTCGGTRVQHGIRCPSCTAEATQP